MNKEIIIKLITLLVGVILGLALGLLINHLGGDDSAISEMEERLRITQLRIDEQDGVISDLQSRNTGLEQELVKMLSDFSDQVRIFAEYEAAISRLESEILALQRSGNQQASEIGSLRTQINQRDQQISHRDQQITALRNSNQELQRQNADLQTQLQTIRALLSP